MNKKKSFTKLFDNLVILIPIILVLLIFISLIFNDSTWGDEAYSMLMIKHSFIDIAKTTALDVHPPYIII